MSSLRRLIRASIGVSALLWAFLGTAALSASDDYLAVSVVYSDGRVTRFDRMPVAIRLATLPEGLRDSGYDDVFRQAVELWTKESDGLVRCVFVDNSSTSVDLPVTWVTRIRGRAQEAHLGKTTLIRPTADTFRVEMEIGVTDASTGRRLTREKMLSVCLHELGHAFGLWGHSGAAEDVMSPSTDAQAPTRRDVETLRRLYALPPGSSLHDAAIGVLKDRLAREPADVETHFLLGNLLLDRGNHDAAIDQFLQTLELDATHQDAAERLVRAYLDAGRADEAIQSVEQAGVQSPEAYNNAARVFYERGEVHEAISALERSLRLDPTFEVARRNLIRLCVAESDRLAEVGEYAGAEALLRRAVELDPRDVGSTLRLSVVLNHLGKDAEAVRILEALLAQQPGNADVRAGLGRTYNNLGVSEAARERWEQAAGHFEAALRYDPALETAKRNYGAAILQWANAVEGSDPNRALALLEKHARLERSAATEVRIGVLHSRRGDYPAAIEAFRRARQIDPDDAVIRKNLLVTHHQYGVELDKTGNVTAAVDQFQKGLALDADHLDLYRSLGQTYARGKRTDDAARAYGEVLKRNPSDAWAQSALVNLYLTAGNEALQKGQFAKALEQFELVPDSARTGAVYGMIGYLYLATEKPVQAVDTLGKALLLNADERSTQSNFDLAVKRLNKAAKERPSPEMERAAFRAEVYDLTAKIAKRPRKADVSRFVEMVASTPNDPMTIQVVQDCALQASRSATPRYPEEAQALARSALALKPSHAELRTWVNGTGSTPKANRTPE